MPAIFSSSRIEPVGPVDARVGADPELAEEAGAVVGLERGLEVVARRARRVALDDLAVRERQLDAGDLDAARAEGHGEPDRARRPSPRAGR